MRHTSDCPYTEPRRVTFAGQATMIRVMPTERCGMAGPECADCPSRHIRRILGDVGRRLRKATH